jgi:methylmalonyl-CoA mutase
METPVSTYAEWQQRVLDELGGVPFERLRAETSDGLVIEPLSIDADPGVLAGTPGQAPFVRGARSERGWWIAQRIAAADPAAANRAALQDLTGGANALRLVLPHGDAAPRPWLARALEGVHVDAIGLILEASKDPRPWLEGLEWVVRERGFDPAEIQGVVHWPQELAPAISPELLARAGSLRTTSVDVRALHAAGATPADQLGAAVAGIAELLRGAEEHGIAVDIAAGRLAVALSVGADVFEGIATLRAARLLWSLLLQAAGVEGGNQPRPFLDVSTSPRSLARIDPWTNVLRGTTEAFAAICGGADALEVWPLDARDHEQTELGRRLARNTQVVLAEEGGLARVLDPAGGAYALENLTLARARKAWQVAREIDEQGGYQAVSTSGWLEARIRAVRTREQEALRQRRRPITGVSEFATLEHREVPGAKSPAVARVPEETRPLAAELEVLRAAAAVAHPAPEVRLLTLGAPADHGARVTFMTNLLAAGGVAVQVSAARQSDEVLHPPGRGPVIVCGSDEAYAAHGCEVVAALRAAGRGFIGVAGRSAALEPSLRAAGATHFVAWGDDVVAYLTEVLWSCGIEVIVDEEQP